MDASLDQHVKSLLKDRKGDWQAIAAGAGVSYSWLSKFYNGRIHNPGYATLRRLAEHLEKSTAKAA